MGQYLWWQTPDFLRLSDFLNSQSGTGGGIAPPLQAFFAQLDASTLRDGTATPTKFGDVFSVTQDWTKGTVAPNDWFGTDVSNRLSQLAIVMDSGTGRPLIPAGIYSIGVQVNCLLADIPTSPAGFGLGLVSDVTSGGRGQLVMTGATGQSGFSDTFITAEDGLIALSANTSSDQNPDIAALPSAVTVQISLVKLA